MARARSSKTYQIWKDPKQALGAAIYILLFVCLPLFSTEIHGQDLIVEIGAAAQGSTIEVTNPYGRVTVTAVSPTDSDPEVKSKLVASPGGVIPSDIKIARGSARQVINVIPSDKQKRIDLTLIVPTRVKLKIVTTAGSIEAKGDFAGVEATTDTGTIITDVPVIDLKYQFTWTESRPRYIADFELEQVKEKSAGRFSVNGRYSGPAVKAAAEGERSEGDGATKDVKKRPKQSERISLSFSTARGIILINVPPNEVTSDLRERPLTNAAKAIIKSGDSLLMEAIRRASPKYFGDYARTLRPFDQEPTFANKSASPLNSDARVKTALLRVTDLRNRAVDSLTAADFEVTENSVEREIVSVRRSTAPFNLVLLLDVSGSVENYVNFIRNVARNFVGTVNEADRVSIVTFNEDVQVLSGFTKDKSKLSESLDTFDPGGGTAYYDALAFTVSETLRPLKGERTAIVILTDGDDNRSFLAFDSLIGSIQESGALIYPLYVPSGLIGMAAAGNDIDPLRKKYMSLSAKSEGEGERLAQVSGGIYYPITDISQIQIAYEDISRQLRSAYEITFRSMEGSRPSKLKVKAKRENAFATVTAIRAGG